MLRSLVPSNDSVRLNCTVPFGSDNFDPLSSSESYHHDIFIRCVFSSVLDLGRYTEDGNPVANDDMESFRAPSYRPSPLDYTLSRDIYLHGSRFSVFGSSFDGKQVSEALHGEHSVRHISLRGRVLEGAGSFQTDLSPLYLFSHPDSQYSDMCRIHGYPGLGIEVMTPDFEGASLIPSGVRVRGRFPLERLLSDFKNQLPLRDLYLGFEFGGHFGVQTLRTLYWHRVGNTYSIFYTWSGSVWNSGDSFNAVPRLHIDGSSEVYINADAVDTSPTNWGNPIEPGGAIFTLHTLGYVVGSSYTGPVDDTNVYTFNNSHLLVQGIVIPSSSGGLYNLTVRDSHQWTFCNNVENRLRDLCVGNFASCKQGLDTTEYLGFNGLEFLAEMSYIFNVLEPDLLYRLARVLLHPTPETLSLLSKSVARQVLIFKFGVEPNLSAVEELTTSLLPSLQHVASILSKPSVVEIRGGFKSPYDLGYDLPAQCSFRTKAKLTLDGSGMLGSVLSLDRLGLLPSFSNIWDLVPYSWVLDQLINIGGMLDLAESSVKMMAYQFHGFVHSQAVEQSLSADFLSTYNLVAEDEVVMRYYRRDISRCIPTLRDTNLVLSPSSIHLFTTGTWLFTKAF